MSKEMDQFNKLLLELDTARYFDDTKGVREIEDRLRELYVQALNRTFWVISPEQG